MLFSWQHTLTVVERAIINMVAVIFNLLFMYLFTVFGNGCKLTSIFFFLKTDCVKCLKKIMAHWFNLFRKKNATLAGIKNSISSIKWSLWLTNLKKSQNPVFYTWKLKTNGLSTYLPIKSLASFKNFYCKNLNMNFSPLDHFVNVINF